MCSVRGHARTNLRGTVFLFRAPRILVWQCATGLVYYQTFSWSLSLSVTHQAAMLLSSLLLALASGYTAGLTLAAPAAIPQSQQPGNVNKIIQEVWSLSPFSYSAFRFSND
jgi:hypothetical protein